jgi:hypothetical protein
MPRDINIKTSSLGKDGESVKPSSTFSAPNDLPNNLIRYCIRALNPPVYAAATYHTHKQMK